MEGEDGMPPEKAPNKGSLIMRYILRHAEHEEILLGEDLSRAQQACASCRSEAQGCQLIM